MDETMSLDRAIPAFTTVVFIWQLWGAGRTFRLPKGERISFRHYLVPAAFIFVLSRGLDGSPEGALAAPGCAGLVAALALFEWARRSIRGRYFSYVFSRDTPAFLWTGGPFAYIRNPFYTSYMLSAASVVVMFPDTTGLVAFTLLVVFSAAAARHEEEKFLHSPLREEYQEYASRTGRFIPGVGRLGHVHSE